MRCWRETREQTCLRSPSLASLASLALRRVAKCLGGRTCAQGLGPTRASSHEPDAPLPRAATRRTTLPDTRGRASRGLTPGDCSLVGPGPLQVAGQEGAPQPQPARGEREQSTGQAPAQALVHAVPAQRKSLLWDGAPSVPNQVLTPMGQWSARSHPGSQPGPRSGSLPGPAQPTGRGQPLSSRGHLRSFPTGRTVQTLWVMTRAQVCTQSSA